MTRAEIRKAAVDEYACEEVVIDYDAEVRKVTDGAWVAAWVWVYDEVEEVDEDEDVP